MDEQYSVEIIDNKGACVCVLMSTKFWDEANSMFRDIRKGFYSFDKALVLFDNGEMFDWYANSAAFTYFTDRFIDEALS